jgi:hypothetical protein
MKLFYCLETISVFAWISFLKVASSVYALERLVNFALPSMISSLSRRKETFRQLHIAVFQGRTSFSFCSTLRRKALLECIPNVRRRSPPFKMVENREKSKHEKTAPKYPIRLSNISWEKHSKK